jgi:phosphoribosylformimino-5-aminoimidazole carboxamide ribotide isomerase
MKGFPIKVAEGLRAATKKQMIVAGGIKSMDEVKALDGMRVDAVVGMAIYTGTIGKE